jgi:Glycoside hydrolase 97.
MVQPIVLSLNWRSRLWWKASRLLSVFRMIRKFL